MPNNSLEYIYMNVIYIFFIFYLAVIMYCVVCIYHFGHVASCYPTLPTHIKKEYIWELHPCTPISLDRMGSKGSLPLRNQPP